MWRAICDFCAAVGNAFFLKPHRYFHDGWPEKFHPLSRKGKR